jgi:hypothetical protein
MSRSGCDGTPDRALCVWNVIAPQNVFVDVTAGHQRAGTARLRLQLKAEDQKKVITEEN